MMKHQVKKVVLAYSGGLDTSVIVPWLKENYGCEVICFTANGGQQDELDGLEAKALASGASYFVQHDLQEEFVRDYLFSMLRAGAVYERKYLLGTCSPSPDRQAPGGGRSRVRGRCSRTRSYRERERSG